MNIQELLSFTPTGEEKYYADLANKIINAFNGSYKPYCFGNIQFHTEPSNNPNRYRVIYIKDKGFTLVQGDGDKGLGWIIGDGEEIGFIKSFKDFLDYILAKVFKSNYTSTDIFINDAVKRILDFNSDIRFIDDIER